MTARRRAATPAPGATVALAAAVLVLIAVAGCDSSQVATLSDPLPVASSSDTADAANATDSNTNTGAAAAPTKPEGKAPGETVALVIERPTKDARAVARTFDDIKFPIEPDAPYDPALLTDNVTELDGKRIAIRGYILPNAQKRMREFVLVRDNQECCFGPGAALYDCILVSMEPGQLAEFSVRPVTVEGAFRIEPFEISGRTLAVFRMTATSVDR